MPGTISAKDIIEGFLDSPTLSYGVFITLEADKRIYTPFANTAHKVVQERKERGVDLRPIVLLDLRMIGDFAKGRNMGAREIIAECLKKHDSNKDRINVDDVLRVAQEKEGLLVFDHAEAVLNHLTNSERTRFLYQMYSIIHSNEKGFGKIFITCAGTTSAYKEDNLWVEGAMGLFEEKCLTWVMEAPSAGEDDSKDIAEILQVLEENGESSFSLLSVKTRIAPGRLRQLLSKLLRANRIGGTIGAASEGQFYRRLDQ